VLDSTTAERCDYHTPKTHSRKNAFFRVIIERKSTSMFAVAKDLVTFLKKATTVYSVVR